MADVFISYKREDRDRAEALARFLEQQKYTVWWDTSLLAGEVFTDVIKEELDQAKKVIVLWSKVAVDSVWVRAEATRAMDQGKLVAASLEQCDLPLPFTQLHTLSIEKVPADFEKLLAPLAAPKMLLAKGASRSGPERKERFFGAAALSKVLIAFAVLMVSGALLYALWQALRVPGPKWQLERMTFIGEPIPLKWTYGAGKANVSATAPVSFEVEYDIDDKFTSGDKRSFFTEGAQRPVGHINGTRYWRIRAVDDGNKHPLSDWSLPIRISQYDSAYRRIEATSIVIVGVSDTDYDDVFKWKDKGWHGFDIALADAVVGELSARIGWHLERKIVAVPWKELLSQPLLGGADMILSAISKREEREKEHKLSFSDTYFCTTQALLFRTGEAVRSIAEMIPGKRFGYQDHTTSEKIVQQLKQKYAFDPHAFDRPEKMLTALLNRDIDLALVDAPFAVDAQRTTRQRGKDRLDLKQFSARDFPESVADKDRFDEYAIGVRVSDELLPLINDSLQKFRADGTLPRLFQTAVREFARGKGTGVPEAGHPLARERLWECPR